MAQQDFYNEVEKFLRKIQNDINRNDKGGFVPKGGIVSLEAKTSALAPALRQATASIITGIAMEQKNNGGNYGVNRFKKYNNIKTWTKIIQATISDIKKTGSSYKFTGQNAKLFGNLKTIGAKRYKKVQTLLPGQANVAWIPGVYIESFTTNRMELVIVTDPSSGIGPATVSKTEAAVKEIFSQIRDEVWDRWIDEIEQKEKDLKQGSLSGRNNLTGKIDLGRSYDTGVRYSKSAKAVQGTQGTLDFTQLLDKGGVVRSHKDATTTGAHAVMELTKKHPQITVNGITLNSIDIQKHLYSQIRIKATKRRFRKKARASKKIIFPGEERLYEVSLSKNTTESTDFRKLLKAPKLNNDVALAVAAALSEEVKKGNITTAQAKGSKSFADDVKDMAILALINEFETKSGLRVRKKVKAKETQDTRYSVNARGKRQPGAVNSKKLSMTTQGSKAVAAMGASTLPRTQTGKRKDKLPTLAKLKHLINRSLGPMIRKNMGRPALQNQTGRFSNSAELVRLKQGKKSLIGEYTYQLNPYATFENLGQKQWPQGYNPKPLITKSIREVAQRHIEAKFTLRRV